MQKIILALIISYGIIIFNSNQPNAATQSTSPASGTCDIWDDQNSIPHIRTKDELTGFACFGYVHGRDRIWQMDFYRKLLQGRGAEFFGFAFIPEDIFLRALDLGEKAKSLYRQLSPKDQSIFKAYAEGVNQGAQEAIKKGVYEFKAFDYLPDPWTPEDTFGLILLQSLDQSKIPFLVQINDLNFINKYGDRAKDLFKKTGLPWDTTILKKGEYPEKSSPLPLSQTSASPANGADSPTLAEVDSILGQRTTGSNNWVLAPSRTENGKALLANDPHLFLNYPPFWHWVHLEAGEIDVIGGSFPGIPGIFSGTNRQVSWGLTTSYLPASRAYFVPEEDLKEAKTVRPFIWVKVWKFKLPFFFKSIRVTPSGLPVLPIPGAPKNHAIVLQWTGFSLKPTDFLQIPKMISTRSVQEMDQVLASFYFPSWNFVFADVQGSIGYRAVGRIPRFDHNENVNQPGIETKRLSEVENNPEFLNPLSPDEMPHLINPKRSYIASANNLQWPDDGKFSLGTTQAPSFRSFRIEERLQKQPQNLKSAQEIQCDLQAVDARFILPLLLSALPKSDSSQTQSKALELLKAWDYETNLECKACAVFRYWINGIYTELGANPESLYRMLKDPSPTPELRKAVKDQFQKAIDTLTKKGSRDFPKWGAFHASLFRNPADPELFARQSNEKGVPTPGDDHTVDVGLSFPNMDSLEQVVGASHRLIVEMSTPPQVYSALSGPNTDLETRNLTDPNSPWQKWSRCEFQKQNFPIDWNQVPKRNIQLQTANSK